ncbi:unnamed protein product [Lactuca virosa]|uniref:C2H2-type domain-containing protein n=1 Tax=Lactuca virosa TaxID=75947 RepID=A0AAU9LU37_9ASTR|nr:unnamed protein product [Lactuca virosa]
MDSGEESGGGGGSSRRLRKRIIKPPPSPEIKKMSGTKKVKKGLGSGPTMEALVRDEDEDGEFACDMEGCNMSFDSKQELIVHKRNVCPVKGCGKNSFHISIWCNIGVYTWMIVLFNVHGKVAK